MDPLLDRIATYMNQDPDEIADAVELSCVTTPEFDKDPDAVVVRVRAAWEELEYPEETA